MDGKCGTQKVTEHGTGIWIKDTEYQLCLAPQNQSACVAPACMALSLGCEKKHHKATKAAAGG